MDTSSELIGKVLKRLLPKKIIEVMNNSSYKINDNSIDRINKLFQENKLRGVKLMSQVISIYPKNDSI